MAAKTQEMKAKLQKLTKASLIKRVIGQSKVIERLEARDSIYREQHQKNMHRLDAALGERDQALADIKELQDVIVDLQTERDAAQKVVEDQIGCIREWQHARDLASDRATELAAELSQAEVKLDLLQDLIVRIAHGDPLKRVTSVVVPGWSKEDEEKFSNDS